MDIKKHPITIFNIVLITSVLGYALYESIRRDSQIPIWLALIGIGIYFIKAMGSVLPLRKWIVIVNATFCFIISIPFYFFGITMIVSGNPIEIIAAGVAICIGMTIMLFFAIKRMYKRSEFNPDFSIESLPETQMLKRIEKSKFHRVLIFIIIPVTALGMVFKDISTSRSSLNIFLDAGFVLIGFLAFYYFYRYYTKDKQN